MVLTRLAHRTRSSMSPDEDVSTFAAHGVTMAIFLSAPARRSSRTSCSVGSRSSPPRPPAVLAFRVSWPDERSFVPRSAALADALARLESGDRARHGRAGARSIADPQRSHVYSSSYAHTFRAAGERSPPAGSSRRRGRTLPDQRGGLDGRIRSARTPEIAVGRRHGTCRLDTAAGPRCRSCARTQPSSRSSSAGPLPALFDTIADRADGGQPRVRPGLR